MAVHNPLPAPEDVQDYPDNSKAVMVYAKGRIRVVERQYYWDKAKKRGLEKRRYLGYVVDGRYYSNEGYAAKFNRDGTECAASCLGNPSAGSAHGAAKPSPEAAAAARHVPPPPAAAQAAAQAASQAPAPASAAHITASSLRADELPLYYAAAQDTDLVQDLSAVFGKENADAVLSIAFHQLSTGCTDTGLFASWQEGRALPHAKSLAGRDMGSFLKEISQTPSWQDRLFAKRLQRLAERQEDDLLCLDATHFSSALDAAAWHLPQTGLLLFAGRRTGLPALFKVLPGCITDITTVQDLLFRLDAAGGAAGRQKAAKHVFAAAADERYCTLQDLAAFTAEKSRVILPAKTDAPWMEKFIYETCRTPWRDEHLAGGGQCQARTVSLEVPIPRAQSIRLWVHVFFSAQRKRMEEAAFSHALEQFEEGWLHWCRKEAEDPDPAGCPLGKSPLQNFFIRDSGIPGRTALKRNEEALARKSSIFGLSCAVSTFACSAEEALAALEKQRLMAGLFRQGISPSVWNDPGLEAKDLGDTLAGRLLVSFAALSISSQIAGLMKLEARAQPAEGSAAAMPPLQGEMSFRELANRLSGPRLIRTSSGALRWTDVTPAQHFLAWRLGHPHLYEEIPAWV